MELRLWRHDVERPCQIRTRLLAQHVKPLRGGGRNNDTQIVVGAQLQEPPEVSVGLLRTHAFMAMRQDGQSGLVPPFVFASRDDFLALSETRAAVASGVSGCAATIILAAGHAA